MKLTKKFIKDNMRFDLKTSQGYRFSFVYEGKEYVVYTDTDRREVAAELLFKKLKEE